MHSHSGVLFSRKNEYAWSHDFAGNISSYKADTTKGPCGKSEIWMPVTVIPRSLGTPPCARQTEMPLKEAAEETRNVQGSRKRDMNPVNPEAGMESGRWTVQLTCFPVELRYYMNFKRKSVLRDPEW